VRKDKMLRCVTFGLLSLSFLFLMIAKADALTISFSDKDYLGGASWGMMEILAYDADTLTVRYEAAGASVIPSGAQVTGFGFTFEPVTTVPDTVSNPLAGDFSGDRDDLNWVELVGLTSIPNPENGDEFTPVVKKTDFFFGVTEGNPGNINPPGIKPGEFDVYYLNFSGLPTSLETMDDEALGEFVVLTGIRLQSLPDSINGGSLFLVGEPEGGGAPPQEQVPEPATILLIGSGLVGLAFFSKRWSGK